MIQLLLFQELHESIFLLLFAAKYFNQPISKNAFLLSFTFFLLSFFCHNVSSNAKRKKSVQLKWVSLQPNIAISNYTSLCSCFRHTDVRNELTKEHNASVSQLRANPWSLVLLHLTYFSWISTQDMQKNWYLWRCQISRQESISQFLCSKEIWMKKHSI